jgi:L-iduronidase
MNISIDCQEVLYTVQPFWNSTGFTPASLLLTEDMRQQIIYCGAIPRNGIRYVRIHYLLELVSVVFDGENATEYDWSRLDQGLDQLVANHLAPVFELMGIPNGQFNSFCDDLQLRRWRNLVSNLAEHLIERYGIEEINTWYFESWNEPDAGWWHEFPHNETAFFNYYDASATGLKAVNSSLCIGGPGTCRTLSNLFKTFLAHCDHGRNYFTQSEDAKGVPLDFISIHEKGAPANKEDITPQTDALLQREKEIIQYIQDNHPSLANLPIMNNECDPQVGWKDFHTWHARPYYAAWAAKSLVKHMTQFIDGMGINYRLLSNDHGFLGSWGNRTLLTHFGNQDWLEDGQSKHANLKAWEQKNFATPPFAMVKKPIFNAMTLFACLGDQRLQTTITEPKKNAAHSSDIGALATKSNEGAISILIYNSNDQFYTAGTKSIQIILQGLPYPSYRLVHYRIDDKHGDPFLLWEAGHAFKIPDPDLLSRMRAIQETQLMVFPRIVNIQNSKTQLKFQLPMHSVSLLLLIPIPEPGLPKITAIQKRTFQGIHSEEHLISWSTNQPNAICSYAVFSQSEKGKLNLISPPGMMSTAFLVTQPGIYYCAAESFEKHIGALSEPILIR